MNNGLVLENLGFKDILSNITCDFKCGTINALIGSSSSGKTTLLKSIAGLIEYSGNIKILGIKLNDQNIEEQRKNIAIYLNLKRLKDKSVFANIIEPLLNLNYEEEVAKKIVYELSKKLGIYDILFKEINELSYSQKKVVAFAQSIIHSPIIILIDNLFESLDDYYKNKIITYLKSIKKNKKSIIIFTTKDSENIFIADNLLIIKDGKIKDQGEVNELLNKENLFIKNDVNLPFISDLSSKIQAYDLIDRPIKNIVEMVDNIWQ